MNRPRLFLSAVSGELRTARQAVASTIRTLGFDPVSQEDFPTGYGELRQWLREQIDACEGLIQLVGQAYGAEPPEVAPNDSRTSYTQFEFLYASGRQKKTWVIVIGEDYPRDHAIEQLDLPPDPAHPDPFGYQADRRAVQESYIERLTSGNHLRHTANSTIELENIVLRLRDELGELRQQSERQQRRLTRAIAAILVALLLLLTGSWWGYEHLHRAVQQSAEMNTEKIRTHLLRTAEEAHRRDLFEADQPADWQERERLREGADAAHAARLARIGELAASFAEIEGSGTATDVFKELTRILTEQGVDEAIAYVDGERPSILRAVRARAAAARERNRADLRPLLKSAELHQTKAHATEASSLYREILAAEPEWPEALDAAIWFHVREGDTARIRTTLPDARRDYEEANRLARRLTAVEQNNTEWQRDAYVSYERLGTVALIEGKLPDAARAFGDSLAIVKMLTARDPANSRWQNDLAVSYSHLGDVAVAEGKLAEAARAYGDSLVILKTLVERDPSDTEWQDSLAKSYDKLGVVAVEDGKMVEAARAYGDSLVIRRTLAEGDPSNTKWQRDLAVAHGQVGDSARFNGKLQDAARAYGEGIAIAKMLAARDHSNTQWQNDLATFYDRLGYVARRQGNLTDAARAYREALAIRRTLAAADSSNLMWQRSLAVSYYNLGDLAELQGQKADSITYYRQALSWLSDTEARGLHISPADQRFLGKLRHKVGDPQR